MPCFVVTKQHPFRKRCSGKDDIIRNLSSFLLWSICIISFGMVSNLRYINFYSSKNKFSAVTMVIGHTPELKRSPTTITIKKKERKHFDDFHRKSWNPASSLDLPSCLSKGSHETLGKAESNTLGRELSTGFWREDVVYILDPVFILDEVLPLLPGGSPCVIKAQSAGSSFLQSPCETGGWRTGESLSKVIFHKATVSMRTKTDPGW